MSQRSRTTRDGCWIELTHCTCWERFGRREGPHKFHYLASVAWWASKGLPAIAECPIVAVYRAIRMHRAWRERMRRQNPEFGTLWERVA